MNFVQLSAILDIDKNERLRSVLDEIEKIINDVRAEGLEDYINEHPEDYPEYVGLLRTFKYYKVQEERLQEHPSKIETVAGVYLVGIKEQHRRYNKLLRDRLHPHHNNGLLPAPGYTEMESIRTFKKKDIPYATQEEIEQLTASGWSKGPGDPRPTFQSSIDWQVDQYCKEGHHIIHGYQAAAEYWGIPMRTLKRYEGPSFNVGNYKAFNVTSFDHFLKNQNKL